MCSSDLDFGGDLDEAGSVVIQPSDGRMLVGGSTYTGGASKFAVARLVQGGGLDSTFDGDGRQTIEFGSTTNIGGLVALESDGKIVVAGTAYVSASGHDFAVARLTTYGAPDKGFGAGDGKVTTTFSRMSDDYGADVLVQPDDRIVVGGWTASSRFALARYLAA